MKTKYRQFFLFGIYPKTPSFNYSQLVNHQALPLHRHHCLRHHDHHLHQYHPQIQAYPLTHQNYCLFSQILLFPYLIDHLLYLVPSLPFDIPHRLIYRFDNQPLSYALPVPVLILFSLIKEAYASLSVLPRYNFSIELPLISACILQVPIYQLLPAS